MKKSIIILLLCMLALTGCQTGSNSDKVTLRLFSNVPDRNSGRGQIEQSIIDDYMKDNPDVIIEVEALPDEQYKQKLSAYANSDDMPDILNHWSTHPAYPEMAKNGTIYKFTESDFEGSNYFPGALDSFMVDGGLYGLPYTNDFMVLYINSGVFEEHSLEIPTNFDELIEVSHKLREKGIEPIAISGMSPYLFGMMLNEVYLKNGGSQEELYEVLDGSKTVKDNAKLMSAIEDFEKIVNEDLFNKGFVTSEYGVAQNLFIQGQTAMYYTGSWESSMDSPDGEGNDDFKNQVHAISLPVSKTGDNSFLTGWYGGGYVVNSNSKNVEASVDFVKYMMNPEQMPKKAWEENAFIPSMSYTDFLTGEETALQNDLTSMLEGSSGMSGTPLSDYLTAKFKDNVETLLRDYSSGDLSMEDFLAKFQETIDNK